jgi:uncharacterized protein YkwD
MHPAQALVLAALLAAAPVVARADLLQAVNSARLQACAQPARLPLHDSPRLRQVAQQMADGETLHSALGSAGYRATHATVLRVSGATSEGEVSGLLSANDCALLTDAQFKEIGVQRRGRDVWIVLAAPAAIPSLRDAPLIRRQILDLVNRARQTGRRCGAKSYPPAAPLNLSTELTSAALTHSLDMAAHAEFDHRGHDGSSPSARVEGAGYTNYVIVGENIAAGVMTPAEVTEGWLRSPPHCENLMDGRFSEIGIAFAVSYSSGELVYWTQDFAAPRRVRSAAAASSP